MQETFSPTAKMSSIRSVMQLAMQHNLTIHQMDVKTTYLNAPIDCELYVEQPEGFVVSDNNNGDRLVCKLNKSSSDARFRYLETRQFSLMQHTSLSRWY